MYTQALDRIQFERIRDKNIVDDELIIRLVPHKGNKTFSIIDTGIGMTKTGRKVFMFNMYLYLLIYCKCLF